MAKPVLTSAQQSAVNTTITQQQAAQTNLTAAANDQNAVITQYQNVDDSFKAFFDWYNSDIIGQYDAELRALNGIYQAQPVSDTDINDVCSNPPGGRLAPTPPAQDIVRISEFDGGNTSTDSNNELTNMSNQSNYETYLKTGISGPWATVSASAVTSTSVTSSSTSVAITDSTGATTIAVGDYLVINDGTTAAIIKATVVTVNSSTLTTISFTFVSTISATIATNAPVTASFSGFTNTERTNKTASTAGFQSIMNSFISSLQSCINSRISNLTSELTALAANQDPDGTANISTATSDDNTEKTWLNNYLTTTDISDTGLINLSTDRSSRTSTVNTRISQIQAAYTGQTTNYYNARYTMANNRGHTARGSLRILANAQNTQSNLTSMATTAGNSVSALNSLL